MARYSLAILGTGCCGRMGRWMRIEQHYNWKGVLTRTT